MSLFKILVFFLFLAFDFFINAFFVFEITLMPVNSKKEIKADVEKISVEPVELNIFCKLRNGISL